MGQCGAIRRCRNLRAMLDGKGTSSGSEMRGVWHRRGTHGDAGSYLPNPEQRIRLEGQVTRERMTLARIIRVWRAWRARPAILARLDRIAKGNK